jgi:hypothetical protein
MIEFITVDGKVISLSYNVLIDEYRASYVDNEGPVFVRNMLNMLDNWEKEKGISFRRVSGSDWQQLLLAVR